MSNLEYTPDVWVVLEIQGTSGVICKILAGWYGGFTAGNSWKLSSGIEKIEQDDDFYVMPNTSGSIYHCHRNNYGMSGYTNNIYLSLKQELGDRVRVLELEEIYATPVKLH
jgi:hypothetical protein